MARMFKSAPSFDHDLSQWDVSKVVDMNNIFNGARAFNQDLSQWDVSKVTSMVSMFANAIAFSQTLRGNAWLCSKADRSSMFQSSDGSTSDAECGG